MNARFNNNLRQGLLSRRNKIAAILENLEFREVEMRVRTLGHEDKLELDRFEQSRFPRRLVPSGTDRLGQRVGAPRQR